MGEYKQEDLHRLWKVEEGIYQEFERVCKENNLRYFATYGTALGAVRHKGFIPWDDDIDVAMPRSDYEKFIQLAPSQLNKPYELMDARITKGYVLPFAKIMKTDTTFFEEVDRNLKYHSGIFMDIFPFDLESEVYEERMSMQKKCWYLARLTVLCEYPKPKLPEGMSGVKKAIAYAGCYVIHGLLRLFGQTGAKMHTRYVSEAMKYSKTHSTGYYGDIALYRNSVNWGDDDQIFTEEDLFPTVKVPFEDIEMAMPHDYKKYLTVTFNDYMTLPDENDRHCHFPAVLEFERKEQ